jgi:hypothetical protein
MTSHSLWHWQEWQEMPYLTCSLLSPFAHGFFTQQWAPRFPEMLVAALQPQAEVFRVRQVHGKQILTAGDILSATSGDLLPPADGVLSDRPDQSVWVASADCTPVLMGDIATGQVAAIHAGWRGTAQRIVPEALSLFLGQGSDLGNIRVALGPAIAAEVYQVDRDVAVELGRSISSEFAQGDTEELVSYLMSLPEPPILADAQPEKLRLDVRRVNWLQLLHLGLEPEQMAVSRECTYQNCAYFFSYRRTGAKQVQWSGIVSH